MSYEVSKDDKAFMAALNQEDDLGMIIKTLIHIEHYLNTYLSQRIPRYEKYQKKISSSFMQKLYLALSHGFPEPLLPAVKRLTEIRNRFAHNLGAQITSDDATQITDCLSQHHPETFRFISAL